MVRRDSERHATYQPESHEWRDWLCDHDELGNLVGKHPMTLSLDVLTAAGHPQTAVRSVLTRLKVMHGVDHGREGDDGFLGLQPQDFPKRLTQVREVVCMACSSGHPSEVRRCAIYDCPAWPLPMGGNPHNPARGRNAAAQGQPGKRLRGYEVIARSGP